MQVDEVVAFILGLGPEDFEETWGRISQIVDEIREESGEDIR